MLDLVHQSLTECRMSGNRTLTDADILFLSQRKIANLVAYCLAYEFEDVFASVMTSNRIEVNGLPQLEFSRRLYKLASFVSGSPKFARAITPYPHHSIVLDHDVELFFPIFNTTYELYSLAMVPNWRQRSRRAACFITEAWPDWLPRYLIHLLSEFDHIFIGCRNSVREVARLTGRPCSYLPFAVDVIRFSPSSADQPRPIAVCNIGRRSSITHQALLEEAEHRKDFYYHYDTVAASGTDLKERTFRIDNANEHRRMLATVLKHSSYYIANRSYVNRPEFTGGRDEISARFYEGAAAGTVMLGEAPRTKEFQRQFDWPDAVIHLPFHSPDIGRFLAELNHDHDRLQAIRRDNIREAALRHDWLHRIQVVFSTFDLPPTEKMRARMRQLDRIAAEARAI